MAQFPQVAQSRSRPLALIMRLVFYCSSANRKTYGVNLDAPHHIHPGVISTKATEAVATFRQPKGPGPVISAQQFTPDITRQSQGNIPLLSIRSEAGAAAAAAIATVLLKQCVSKRTQRVGLQPASALKYLLFFGPM